MRLFSESLWNLDKAIRDRPGDRALEILRLDFPSFFFFFYRRQHRDLGRPSHHRKEARGLIVIHVTRVITTGGGEGRGIKARNVFSIRDKIRRDIV